MRYDRIRYLQSVGLHFTSTRSRRRAFRVSSINQHSVNLSRHIAPLAASAPRSRARRRPLAAAAAARGEFFVTLYSQCSYFCDLVSASLLIYGDDRLLFHCSIFAPSFVYLLPAAMLLPPTDRNTAHFSEYNNTLSHLGLYLHTYNKHNDEYFLCRSTRGKVFREAG